MPETMSTYARLLSLGLLASLGGTSHATESPFPAEPEFGPQVAVRVIPSESSPSRSEKTEREPEETVVGGPSEPDSEAESEETATLPEEDDPLSWQDFLYWLEILLGDKEESGSPGSVPEESRDQASTASESGEEKPAESSAQASRPGDTPETGSEAKDQKAATSPGEGDISSSSGTLPGSERQSSSHEPAESTGQASAPPGDTGDELAGSSEKTAGTDKPGNAETGLEGTPAGGPPKTGSGTEAAKAAGQPKEAGILDWLEALLGIKKPPPSESAKATEQASTASESGKEKPAGSSAQASKPGGTPEAGSEAKGQKAAASSEGGDTPGSSGTLPGSERKSGPHESAGSTGQAPAPRGGTGGKQGESAGSSAQASKPGGTTEAGSKAKGQKAATSPGGGDTPGNSGALPGSKQGEPAGSSEKTAGTDKPGNAETESEGTAVGGPPKTGSGTEAAKAAGQPKEIGILDRLEALLGIKKPPPSESAKATEQASTASESGEEKPAESSAQASKPDGTLKAGSEAEGQKTAASPGGGDAPGGSGILPGSERKSGSHEPTGSTGQASAPQGGMGSEQGEPAGSSAQASKPGGMPGAGSGAKGGKVSKLPGTGVASPGSVGLGGLGVLPSTEIQFEFSESAGNQGPISSERAENGNGSPGGLSARTGGTGEPGGAKPTENSSDLAGQMSAEEKREAAYARAEKLLGQVDQILLDARYQARIERERDEGSAGRRTLPPHGDDSGHDAEAEAEEEPDRKAGGAGQVPGSKAPHSEARERHGYDRDDDIVTRQVCELAEREEDPEVRKHLKEKCKSLKKG